LNDKEDKRAQNLPRANRFRQLYNVCGIKATAAGMGGNDLTERMPNSRYERNYLLRQIFFEFICYDVRRQIVAAQKPAFDEPRASRRMDQNLIYFQIHHKVPGRGPGITHRKTEV